MGYLLKLADRPLIEFEMASEGREVLVEISHVDPDALGYLPIDWPSRSSGEPEALRRDLASWLRNRAIPSNRAYVNSFLAKLGLSEHDVVGIMRLCHGLSLNDSYWIDGPDRQRTFEEVNLYDNGFSAAIARMAFTGTGSYGIPGYSSSPEFTTNGAYAKCWRRMGGKVYLFKEGSVGAANTGGEPYAEYYASQLARTLGIDAVSYVPAKWKGHFCSKCELFTSKDRSFVSAGRLVRSGGIDAVAEFYRSQGEPFAQAFANMLVLDALILNTDRHFGNFGVLVDSTTNQIVAPAPLFDHGCSLLYASMESDYKNLDAYMATQLPRAYVSFIDEARRYLGHEQRDMLRHALEFKFEKHKRYNWSDWRLRALEGMIHGQARKLLAG